MPKFDANALRQITEVAQANRIPSKLKRELEAAAKVGQNFILLSESNQPVLYQQASQAYEDLIRLGFNVFTHKEADRDTHVHKVAW